MCDDLGLDLVISIHAPREGSDHKTCAYVARYTIFQSTLPVRGATIRLGLSSKIAEISIHAPREGSDRIFIILSLRISVFQSTLPVRGATPA